MPKMTKGVVVLLDFLGVGTADIHGCAEFLGKRGKVLEGIEKAKHEFSQLGDVALSIRTFGDSILLTWPKGIVHPDDVLLMGETLKHVFHLCVNNQILVRGAVSAGEFVEIEKVNDSVVIGPAVADVAGWFERADWAGIVVTPRTGHLLDFRQRVCFCEKDLPPELIERTFVKYPVPLKRGFTGGVERHQIHQLWCLAWPEWLVRIPGSDEKREAAFYEQMSLFNSIPVGTEQKYSNTLDFFNWYWKTVWPRIKNVVPSQHQRTS